MSIDNLNNEERILINGICKNENLTKLSKKDVENSLLFSRQIMDEDDDMLTDLVNGAYEKVKDMTDEEWNELKMLIPFPVIEGADELSA